MGELPRRYFNLNIRHKDDGWRASRFLGDRTQPRAPIFYGRRTISELRHESIETIGLRAKELNEARRFLNLLDAAKGCFQPVIVTVDEGRVWIYELMAGPHEYEFISGFAGDPGGILIKGYAVSHLAGPDGLAASDVPLVLSSMKANQAFSRNTFTEIGGGSFDRYRGNVAALKAMLREKDKGFRVDPLDCLSAVEFETLVAKLFEAQGCFVPAYRGGVMKDVDLYVHTRGARSGAIKLPPDGVLSVQLKLSAKADDKSLVNWLMADPRRLLISLDDSVSPAAACCHERWITRGEIRTWIDVTPAVSAWLERSLDWLPQEWRGAEPLQSVPCAPRRARRPR
ncbi:hypothetical protein [Dyella sp.]|uniref:hypothetical protein n=1 Tax=Dyella sp. TaxID=1869338 RepID=UPI003F7E2E15